MADSNVSAAETGTSSATGLMKKVSEYKAHAAECRKMASQMSNPEHRKQLIEMAETWDMLAAARAKQLGQENDEPPQSE